MATKRMFATTHVLTRGRSSARLVFDRFGTPAVRRSPSYRMPVATGPSSVSKACLTNPRVRKGSRARLLRRSAAWGAQEQRAARRARRQAAQSPPRRHGAPVRLRQQRRRRAGLGPGQRTPRTHPQPHRRTRPDATAMGARQADRTPQSRISYRLRPRSADAPARRRWRRSPSRCACWRP